MRSVEKMGTQLATIQYLRAFAALLVLFHHARIGLPWLYDPFAGSQIGNAGVDIFFVISGFIMFTAARAERPIQFIKRRIIRVVPLYWIATTFAIVRFSHLKLAAMPAAEDILRSLFFVPYARPDGMVAPILIPGWTLNYEMFFYIVFAVAIASRRVVGTTIGILSLVVLIGIISTENGVVWSMFTSPLLLEFLAGVLIGRAYAGWDFSAFCWLLPVGAASLFLWGDAAFARWIIWGLPAVLIVVGALGFEDIGLKSVKALQLLGNASYSLYLFHTAVLPSAARLGVKMPLTGWPQFLAYMTIVSSACIGVAVLFHWLIEMPILRRLNRLSQSPECTTAQNKLFIDLPPNQSGSNGSADRAKSSLKI